MVDWETVTGTNFSERLNMNSVTNSTTMMAIPKHNDGSNQLAREEGKELKLIH